MTLQQEALRYFGTDGIRGRVGTSPITPEFVLKLGYAAGCVLARSGHGKVLIGKDTRISGYMFESALEAGLSAAGMDALLLGPMPTPAIAYLTRTLRAQAGIVISASHNPHYDNGIKFFSAQGTKLPYEIELAIEAMLDMPISVVDSALLGKATRVKDAPGRYIEFCKSTVASNMTLNGLKVVVDCAHGAAYHIAPCVLRELGAEVIELGVAPNGLNINHECGATDVKALKERVLREKAMLGIALDGDGDRVIMVDHLGHVRDGDDLLYVLATMRSAKSPLKGGVVGTVMSNLALEEALQVKNIPFVRALVGDKYVLSALQEHGWMLGGEPSGHMLTLDWTTTGDGIISALQVLRIMQLQEKSLYELCEGFTKYPQVIVNVKAPKDHPVMEHPTLQQAIRDVEKSLSQEGRLLLRRSGTEALIRIMLEGKDHAVIHRLAMQLHDIILSLVNDAKESEYETAG